MYKYRIISGLVKIAQQGKALAAKLDELSLTPRIFTAKGENQLLKVVL